MGNQKINNIYQEMCLAKSNKQRLIAILIDPDDVDVESLNKLIPQIINSPATHILVGGSLVESNHIDEIILGLKSKLKLPILLFPGHPSQISIHADGILFLSLLSGRNPDYLAEHQVNAVPYLSKSNLEIIPTAYLLIESGAETAVERISKTRPLDRNNTNYVAQTALAGQYLGHQLVYLEAGSGAELAVPLTMIKKVSKAIAIPLIVGGGIRTQKGIDEAFEAGADLVVIGTAFENDPHFFEYD
ncbi:MAG: geranylgeranylglyceryl/heptaprenylglyceryl phosphate synthase [Candidatus Paceibacterota bacterium]